MQGFIVFDYAKQYGQAKKELTQWLSEGKLKRKETIVKGGLEKASEGLRELYNGLNTGKWSNSIVRSWYAKPQQVNFWLRFVLRRRI